LDSSTVIEVLLRTDAASHIEQRIFSAEESLHAPHLLDLEVAQVMRRYYASGEIASERGGEAIDDLTGMPITRYPHDLLLPRIWELRHNLTAYDAAYVALAEILPAVFLTCDARLASAPGHSATIELI
jgi:predicted nucleic acid-binding protein